MGPTPHLEDRKKKKKKKKKNKKKNIYKFAVKRPSHMVPTVTMPRSHWRKPDLTGESLWCRQQLEVKATDILELVVKQLGARTRPWIAESLQLHSLELEGQEECCALIG